MNQLFLVGRVIDKPQTTEENGKTSLTIKLAINRQFKNNYGIYETDFFDINIYNYTMIEQITNYLKKGDIIGIRGRLESDERKNAKSKIIIVADRVTFLSSQKSVIDEDNEE